MYDYEIHWEKAMVNRGIDRYLAAVEGAQYRQTEDGRRVAAKAESNTSYGVYLLRHVFQRYEETIEWFVKNNLTRPGKPSVAASIIAACEVREVAYLAARCVIDSISRTERLTSLAFRIASHIEDHMRFSSFDSTHPKYYRAAMHRIEENHTSDYRAKRRILVTMHNRAADPNATKKAALKKAAYDKLDPIATQELVDEMVAKCDDARWVEWSPGDKGHLGGQLIDLLVLATSEYQNGESAVNNCLQADKRIPGTGLVEIVSVNEGRNNTGVYVVATEQTIERVRGNMSVAAGLHPEFLPTLMPPKPWTTPYDGGYWLKHMRERKPLLKSSRKHMQILENAYMPDVYAAVNAAQNVAWEVNGFVLAIAQEQFASPHGVKMPSQEPVFIPDNPLGDLDQADMTDREFRAYKKAVRANLSPDEKAAYAEWCEIKRDCIVKDNERKSKVLNIGATLRVARMMAQEDEFYYVHTLDYRGRLYPCGTGLNPQGTDLSKALLRLHNGTALGKHGFWHMALHAAGVYGVDKVSLEDRVQWVLDNRQSIILTGNDPNQTVEFWAAADKPYMFLAACQELSEVFLMYPLPAVNNCGQSTFEHYAAGYKSHLTGNQDGSCNGIQHFSAMLRDPVGARAVNMLTQPDGALPEDIYNETCKYVIAGLQRDIDNNVVRNGLMHKALDNDLRRLLLQVIPHMSRKTTKRSTMIVPYGGTKRSCLKHVKDWVIETNEKVNLWDEKEVYKIALPLHHYVWHALDTVVVAARKAMQFLRDLIKVNCSVNLPMSWVTPTGFIAYQDIKEVKTKSVNLRMYGKIRIQYTMETDDLNKHKMASSFPPNFVHSMDAAHLMKTVVASLDAGIEDFALVHDSYGVPFGHVEQFHRIIREQFCQIYEHNVLVGLKRQQQGQFPHMADKYPADEDVEWGDYDINEVKKAIHFFR